MAAANVDRCAEVATPFGLVPHFVLLIKEVTSGALWLYVYLCTRASRKTGLCRVSLHRAAHDKGVEVRTVQIWRAQLECLGLIVTFQKTGCSSKFLVIRHPGLREWAKQQNQINLGPKRQKFRSFGRKGAKAKAPAAQPNPDSFPSESRLAPTGANLASAITESKHSSFGNIEPKKALKHQETQTNCLASNTLVENETHLVDCKNHMLIGEGLLDPPKNFRGFDLAGWEQWLADAFPGSQHIEWLMEQVDRVKSELDITNTQAQWILEKCLRWAKKENKQFKLPEIVSETIEALRRCKNKDR